MLVVGKAISLSGQSLVYNSAHVVDATSISTTGTAALNVSGGTSNSVASDYSFTPPSATVTNGVAITSKTLTVAAPTITAAAKTYDGTVAATGSSLSGGSVTGFVGADSGSLLVLGQCGELAG